MEKIMRLVEYVMGYLDGVWTEADLFFAFKINTDREDAEEIAKKAVNAALVSPVMLRRTLFVEVV